MMEIGKIQKLKVIKEKDFGIYLSDGDKADAQIFLAAGYYRMFDMLVHK